MEVVCRWRGWREFCVLLHLTVFAVGLSDRCSLFGRHHVHTFDGILYQFPGDCSYLLAGDCDQRAFTLLGDFVRGQRSGVTLFLGEVFELHLSVNGHLSQGQKRLSLPYAFQGVFVGSELGFYKMWSEEFGFSVTIDNQANVALTMAKHHSNHTCGLCGNFNGEPDDDYTAQEGFLTEDSYDFANSWALKGAGEPCRRVSPPSQSCNTTADTPTVLSRCSVLQNSPVFLRCANVVSPETFLSICEEEACHCGQGEGLGAGPDCHCNVLLEFARTCLAHGQLLNGWLEDSQCSPRCPVGMQYKECARSCSTTCQSLNIQEVCNEECVDGCTCPVGKVIDGDRCVEVSQCSCVHMGRHFPPGSSISQDCNTCICRHGSWECTNQGCPGECMVTGQSHFKTFDNKFFTFSGHCQYLLAKDCTDNAFSVIIETVQCADETDAVCTRSVTLSLKSLEAMTVKLKHGGVVSVNDLDIRTPMNHGRLRIQRMVQSGVRVLYGNDLHLEWDGRGHVLLKLWPVWAGNTCGLCGNYNGNQGDDFLSAAGLVEAGPQAFGQSWRINGDCNSAPRPDTDPCSLNPKRVRFAEEACGMMMSEVFRPCHFLVNPLPFLRFCRYDVCVCSNGEECLCSALASYAAACSARGVLLTWRTPEHCAMKCPVGQVYETCGSVCQRSCRTLSGKEPGCTEQTGCEEGCFCPPGQYLSDTGECVSPEFCPCLHDGQLYQPNDVYADHNSICYCENGSMKCSSNEMSETMLSDMFYEDEQPFSRERRSAPCAPPLRHVGCEGGGQGLECSRTCQNLDLPCLSLACRPGCLCPNGTVRHRRECIVPEQCPCYHNKRAYAPGQRITVDCNTCVCENRHWHCTKQVCDGVCRTVGEGHYITFDGLQYSFPGLCQYVLVQDQCGGEEGSFRVLVENEACGVVGHRCAKAVTVFYKGGIITMEHGQVRMRKPVMKGSEVEIVRSGQFFILLLGKHISISWDLGTRLLVHISSYYRERVCGLCGNYDGNLNNDLLSSNNQLEVDSAHFGNSWKVKPSCADATQPSPPCSNNIVKLVMVEQSCRVLSGTLFRDCNSLVDPEPYVEMCVEAACSCPTVGDCVCFCDVIAAYAQACSERGMAVSWRTNDLCPLSCEDLNIAAEVLGGEPCQWRYNTCSSACPITCQHPEPLPCPFTCLEGCHATCPPGQLLDEVSMRCVEPTQCHVCYHDGERISHGNKVILNHDDPKHCQICHCENNTLSCKVCPVLEITVSTTLPADLTTPTALPFSTLMPEHSCDRAMDLAFLLDGSAALSEEDFLSVKEFILSVVDRFRMGSAHTRATVLLYHSGVKTYDLQVQKWLFKKTVRELHYSGGDVAFLDEAVKYLAIHIYDKNKREHAGRVAIILTANINPRPLRRTVKLLRTKDITTLTLALGPEASWSQVNEITKARPDNRAYQLNSVAELPINFLEVTDYLCTLGLEPETPKPHPTKPSSAKLNLVTTTTKQPQLLEPNPTQQISLTSSTSHHDLSISTQPANLALTTTTSPAPSKEITFILEGSDSVGEVGFNKSLHFLEEVISQLAEEDEQSVRVTVIQYSVTITVEITRWEIQWHRTQLLQRLREIRWRGGAKTNTGAAISQTFQEIITDRTSSTTPPLVFLVTENPPTDVITRPLSHTHSNVFPIGVGRKVTEVDLLPLSSPQRPLMVEDYDSLTSLVHRVVNITRTTLYPRSPTLPPLKPSLAPRPTLPPSVPCRKPMDILFLLGGKASVGPDTDRQTEGETAFEDMKTFVKAFINSADIGRNGIQVGVFTYGETSRVGVAWNEEQNRPHLLTLVDQLTNPSHTHTPLGAALRYTVQMSMSPSSGARVGVAKVVVMLVMDRSTDELQKAANEALTAGVSVFPIGIGHGYNRAELHMLGSHGNQDNTLHLNSLEELMMLLTLDKSYVDRLCRAGPPGVCVDDDGNQRRPGESWLLPDGCHSVLCNPGGAVTVQNHKVNCDRLEPPVCISYMSPVRVEETCGCRWDCPCVCMGSSTNHVVRFDSLALKLDGEGICSYTLLTVAGGKMVIGGSEVTLHMGTCQGSANHNDICMKAMEVTHGLSSVLLKDDMTVTVNGAPVSMPYHSRQVEVMRFGEVMFQLKSVEHGYILAFTPQNNEFTLTLSSSSTNHTAGLCGLCGEETVKRLSLRNGSLTLDPALLLSDWSVPGGEGVCVPRRSPVCVYGASRACEVLRSEVFSSCHTHVPIMPFITRCQKEACQETDVCDVISSYTHLCRQRGLCVHWRSSHLCPMQCPSIMEYDACRMGCVEDCSSINLLPGDTGVFRGNKSACMTTPTEGCFCPQGTVLLGGECVSPDVCNQCVDQHGHRHQYLHTWVPEDNHCQICMCLDYQRINCTAKPCLDAKAPVCGPCEVLREKRESKCCPEYECVCDMVSCELPEIPRCEDGLTVVLTNPGECQPIHQCACKKEECSLQAPPACPSHRRLSVKQTQCCDSFQCVCDCHNSTHSCPPGFISSFSTNDCGCTETACMPDQVCVVGGVVYHVGSQWEEGCEKCSCTQQRDSHTNLHIAQCVPPVCDHTCPLGSVYVESQGKCCGSCRKSSCVENDRHTPGDIQTEGRLRKLGEVWRSPEDMCVLHQCVSVGDGEVFITHTNVSCPPLDPPPCPLGTELHCDTSACCPQCHCAPQDACVLNHTLIGAGERLMVDMCTHCSCSVEDGAVKRYKLSCRRISCPTCPEGYVLEEVPESCCGRCVATACIVQQNDGHTITIQVNTTLTEGCSQFSCGVNSKGELVLKTILTTCPPFERQLCLDHGGKVSQIGTSCCEMCTEPECTKMVGTLNYIKVDDCQSQQPIELHYCEGKCHSKSMYSLETNSMKKECVCCTAMKTEPLSVPLLCPNGTLTHHNVMSVTACDCQDLHCT
ncbi:von Willebrand factor isoform X2 [Esox lucius]|uniref:von Willebrand factor n=1 Tax=Esox lucius TaxID=8010 RepID=A0A6Q2X308_ESOLU|nr:von Willebrand factor isoform X1 [Esox lucius]XP_034144186.1 von Willebrand factor isoform X2 [Esox lucius]